MMSDPSPSLNVSMSRSPSIQQVSAKWTLFWKQHDPDDVFAYNTIKFVTIRDRHLGMLHHAFQLGIIVYVIGIVILYQKQFLKREIPNGLIRMSIINGPAGAIDMSAIAGCTTNYSSTGPFCTYPTQDEIVTGGGSSLIHLASYYTATSINKNCTNPSTCTDTVGVSTSYIVGNFDQFNLSIDHSFQTAMGVTLGDSTPEGWLDARKDGSTASYKKKLAHYRSNSADQIPINLLLAATNNSHAFNMDATANEYLIGDPSYQGPVPYRQFGVVLLMVVEYSNIDNYYSGCRHSGGTCFVYNYKASVIDSIEDFTQDTVYTAFPTSRTVLERRGVRVMAIMSGEIGSFNFQVLLVQLTTSLALIKVATLIVDQIACRFLPRKAAYRDAKYERTEDFSDMFKKKKQEKQKVEMDDLKSSDGASASTNT